MREKRSRLSQSTLADGRVLVCKGVHSDHTDNVLSSAEIYDPITFTWSWTPRVKRSAPVDEELLAGGGANKRSRTSAVAVVVKPIVLPPIPSTDTMLQGEKAKTLRSWLTTAEGLLRAEEKRVKQGLHQACEKSVAQARRIFDVEVRKLKQEKQRCIAAAQAHYDQQLTRFGAENQQAVEQQIANMRRLTEEAERLAALLENSAPGPAAPGPVIAARPEEHYDMTFDHNVMADPVLTACVCGTSFERAPLEAWLKDHDSCPKCGADLPVKVVIPNTSLKNMIRDWQQPMQ
eukprot:m.141078 g.141078  ORF g.141078 m.141078 type:complete len:290 (+) comp11550_c0_seq9:3-872(+)